MIIFRIKQYKASDYNRLYEIWGSSGGEHTRLRSTAHSILVIKVTCFQDASKLPHSVTINKNFFSLIKEFRGNLVSLSSTPVHWSVTVTACSLPYTTIHSTNTFSYKAVKWPRNRIIVNCLQSTTTFLVRNKSTTFGARVSIVKYPAWNKFSSRKRNFMNSVKYWYCDADSRTLLDSKVSSKISSTTNIQEFWMQRILILISQKWYILTNQLHFQLLIFLWYRHMNPSVTGHQTSLKTEWCVIWTVVKEMKWKNCVYTYINYSTLCPSLWHTLQYSQFSITIFMYSWTLCLIYLNLWKNKEM
jgi:hypothetical protein